MDTKKLEALAKLIRYYIIVSTTAAGSGHPSSSLSATDLMTVLMFGGFFRADLENPSNPDNDRLIFSKGHAAPLLYALYAAAGKYREDDLKTLRRFDSMFEGHPTLEFSYTEAATGSLGQGLSVGVGMALCSKMQERNYRTFVLLGDSEMAEGSVWEAMQVAAYYKLNNLIGILDVNRLGQAGETMYGHDTKNYERKARVFGWQTVVIDGHDYQSIDKAWRAALDNAKSPVMIIAKTIKGKGVREIENKEGWHGKALPAEMAKKAIAELGEIDKNRRGEISPPQHTSYPSNSSYLATPSKQIEPANYKKGDMIATRKAYGNALVRLGEKYPRLVALDAEVSNSTFSEKFKIKYPERFFEMFIAEQNMAGAALGLARRGYIPFVSTFAAFLTRAFDQIRMAQYSGANIKFVGSHAGVSIGEDGASQMGLEEIAMFRTLLGSVVLYPGDAVSAEKLVEAAAEHQGIVYIQTTRCDTPVIYDNNEEFKIGGSKTVRSSDQDAVTVLAAGITLPEALKAYEALQKEGVNIRVIDLYSIKPIDQQALDKAAVETKAIITVEDHFAEGGLGEAVAAALAPAKTPVYILAVRKMPHSGSPAQLLGYEEISKKAIVGRVRQILGI